MLSDFFPTDYLISSGLGCKADPLPLDWDYMVQKIYTEAAEGFVSF